MDSLTKVRLTDADLARVAQVAFGKDARIATSRECTEGWFNTIHAFTLADGREAVLKLAPPDEVSVLRYEKGLLATEVEVLRLLAPWESLPVPRVLHVDDSRTILPQAWFLMERVPGTSFSAAAATMSDTQKAVAQKSLGRINASLNRIQGPAFGAIRSGGYRSPSWSQALTSRFADLLADAEDGGIALPQAETILDLVASRSASLDLVTEPRLVHWDLHDGNAFVGANGEISGIIDPDRALWGDPLMEVYFAPFMEKNAFLEGYGDAILKTPGARERREVYDLYLALVMVIECTYRRFIDPGHIGWTNEQLNRALAKFSR